MCRSLTMRASFSRRLLTRKTHRSRGSIPPLRPARSAERSGIAPIIHDLKKVVHLPRRLTGFLALGRGGSFRGSSDFGVGSRVEE